MKSILVSVSCRNEWVSDYPNVFYLKIDDFLKSRIIKLSEVVSELDVFSIKELNSLGDWGVSDFVSSDDNEMNEKDFQKVISEALANTARVECSELRVYKHNFSFLSIPKHGSSSEAYFTDPIPISFLKDSNPASDRYIETGY